MKCLGDCRRVHIVNSVQRLLSLSSSSAKRPATKIQISKRLFRSRALPVVIALGVLLAGLTLSPSMRGMFTRSGSVAAATESISTFTSDCTTPSSAFNLGDTVCAVATGAPFPNQRRFQWVTPDGSVAQQNPINSDPASDTFTIPTTGQFAQVGTWTVKTINRRGGGIANAQFVVKDPQSANVDLTLTKYGPSQVSAGSNINYRIELTNKGPNDAQVVTLTDLVPAGTTFVSEAQNSGPAFTCVTPTFGGTGTISCTIATLPANSTAVFTLAVNVSSGTPDGTTVSNTASVSSATHELNPPDNTSTVETTVTGTSTVCTLNCPSTITQDNDANQCSAVVSYSTVTTSGNCGSPPDNTVSCNPPSGSTFPIGSTTVTCTTKIGDSCSFTVTVHDSRTPVQPTINCPNNVSAGEDAPDLGSAMVNYTAPATTGNCVTTVCDPPSGSRFSVGTTTVKCSATDSSNNTVSCSFTVTVTGTGACSLTCPGDITQTASSGCSAVVNYTSAPTTSGNCGTVTCTPASGSTFQVGTTAVTCTSDQGPSCTFTVTVNEITPPTITTCASNKTITADANCEAAIPSLIGEVAATDNCTLSSGLTKSQSPTEGTIVGIGDTVVTITVEDSSGNAATCTATVTVRNSVTTTITCPAEITVPNDHDQCGAVVSYTVPTGSNSCSSLDVTCLPASGTLFSIGATNVTCTATDVSGNTVTCTFKVTVDDTQPPTIGCPANITQDNDQDQCGAVVNYASPTATDNCPDVTANCSPASGTQFAVGATTVNCTATDTAGHTATCSFTVTVNDNQSPKITCPSNIAVGTPPNSGTATVHYAPTVSDNCPGVTATCIPASDSPFAVGTTTVTCTATDTAGHTATCSFTVTVTDNQPPTITCPASITQSNDANQCGGVVTYPPPTVTDNSPGATASCSPASGSIFPVGVTTVTCTATDVGGNHATCSFTVTVRDTQAPTITCPANITAPNTPGQCSASVNPGTATATDNCPGVTVVGARSDGLALNATYPVGTTTITWTARDAAGNQTSCTQTIVVNDTQTPTITMRSGQNMELQPPNHQYQTIRVSDFVVSAGDNCSGNLTNSVVIASISSDEPDDAPGDGDGNTTNDIVIAADCKSAQVRAERQATGNGRVYTITFRVRDAAGNVKTSTAKVSVPKSQNNNNNNNSGGAIDDGPNHTVNGTCP